MLPCVMYSLLGNAGIDLVDLDINEAAMRLSSRITSWSEAGERLRSRITSWSEAGGKLRSRVTSWSVKTCTVGTDSALRRACPGRGNVGGSHGCHELPHSAVCAAQDRMDETVVSVEDADVEAETILDLDASGVVQSMLLVEADTCDGDISFQSSSNSEEASFFLEPREREKMATTVQRSCRRT